MASFSDNLRVHILFLGVSIFAFALYAIYLAALPKPLPGIPYNVESVGKFFGDVPLFKRAKHRRQWIWSQPREHGGPISQVFLFPFRRPTVLVTDYREAVDILRSKEFDRGNRNKECIGVVAPNFHFTMQTADPQFSTHKKLIRDLMMPNFLKQSSAPLVYEKAIDLINFWKLKISKANGSPFAGLNDLKYATIDMICAVAFGIKDTSSVLRHESAHLRAFTVQRPIIDGAPANFPSAPVDRELDALFNMPSMVAIAQSSPFPLCSQILALLNPKNARAHWNRKTLIRHQVDKCLQQRSSANPKTHISALGRVLWREMEAAKEGGREPDYYSPVIRDEILGYVLGGHDTTAAILSWWVKYMSSYQLVQTPLREALQQGHSLPSQESRVPTIDEIREAHIPYLDAVIEETLRYASVATLVARTSTCDTQILGYQIPKGTDVLLSLTGPSMTEPALPTPETSRSLESQGTKDRVPPWGEDISQFMPERWLKLKANSTDGKIEEDFDKHAGPNLAFAVGSRQCFGRALAYLMLKVAITLMTWNFEFNELDPTLNRPDVVEKLVNLPKDCYVKLKQVHMNN